MYAKIILILSLYRQALKCQINGVHGGGTLRLRDFVKQISVVRYTLM